MSNQSLRLSLISPASLTRCQCLLPCWTNSITSFWLALIKLPLCTQNALCLLIFIICNATNVSMASAVIYASKQRKKKKKTLPSP